MPNCKDGALVLTEGGLDGHRVFGDGVIVGLLFLDVPRHTR